MNISIEKRKSDAECSKKKSVQAAEITSDINGTCGATHSAFSIWQKRWIVFVSAFAAWFSTASSFLFFPVIDSLAKGLNTSVQNINLTVTSYLIVAGIAPALTATISDRIGRRPAFVASFAVFLAANLGLALQKSFPALFVLRMMQASGVAGTFAIAYGVLADITTPAERGSYVGVVAFCTNTAPSVGPVIASALNASLGWRSIFWFLVACSGTWLLLILLTLPETLRRIVGNGSIRAHSLIYFVPLRFCQPQTLQVPNPAVEMNPHEPDKTTRKSSVGFKDFWAILCQRDKALVMSAIAILYMVWNCLQASLSTLFIQVYHFTYLQAGLIYIPFGLGVGCAGFLTGRLLDHDYRHVARKNNLPTTRSKRADDMSKFPIEQARFRSTFVPLTVVSMALIAYGWCIRYRVHFAVPLALQLLLGMSLQVCFTTLNTLLMDLDPERAATAQAVSNLFRCLLAAGAVALLQVVLNAIAEGWTFTIIAMCASLCFGIFWAERVWGMKWRLARISTEQRSSTAA